MGNIDRIRYYDGEFLRASDFGDEQSYHVEMRRRLNRYLHLYGIVEGLQLQNDNSAGVSQVSILSGMAIDAYGREIYVFQPKTLGDADISNNRISQSGQYDVWLRYNKAASTPPSAGYSSCNQMNQYTRWGESFSVVLLASPSQPFTNPGFAVDDTDDPSQDQVGVLLGTVNVDPASASGVFYGAAFDPNRCQLLGVIAQTIQVPPSWDVTQGNPPPFSFLNTNTPGFANTPLSPPASLEIVPNIFADQNLIVGPDFALTVPSGGATTISFNPSTSSEPAAGNVKIAGDLFVQGNIYNLITSNTAPPTAPSQFPPPPGTDLWLGISAYVLELLQSGMPEFVISPPTAVTVPPGNPAMPFAVPGGISVNTTRVKQSSTVIAGAAISGIQFNTNASFTAAPIGVFLNSVTAIVIPLGTAGVCNFSVTFTATGYDTATPAQPMISRFYITAFALCPAL